MYDNHHMWSHSHLSHTPFNPLPLTLQTLYPCYKGRGIEGRGRGLAFHTLGIPLEGPMPHRQETLDQQMLDSNWKKHINMGMLLHVCSVDLMFISCCLVNSLKWKYVKALPAMQESLDIFNELDRSVDPEIRKAWEEQERLAMKFRGEYLDVYNVKKEKGKFLTPTTHNIAYIGLQFLEIYLVLLLLDQAPAPTVITQPLCGCKLV
jgi:hypothetical protein